MKKISIFEGDTAVQLPRLQLPSLRTDQLPTRANLKALRNELLRSGQDVDQLPTQVNLRALRNELLRSEQSMEVSWALSDMSTWILPVIPTEHIQDKGVESRKATVAGTQEQATVLSKLIKSSGIYALSSVAAPLVALVLAPFLTYHLSPSDYGVLAITNTAIGLSVGVTQLGLASAFFRAYNYDYTSQRDRRDVVATATALLCLISIPTAIMVAIMAPWLANLLFGRSSFSNTISLAGGVILMQNLTVPGMAWLRAEGRPLPYSLLSIANLIVTLFATIYLIGILHLGISGSVIATGSGYACIVICTLPIIVLRAGIKIRVDIAQNLLTFGLPLIVSFASSWVLQLSDRYLLGLFSSLAETAQYTVAYSLGSVLSVVIIGPFNIAWPAALFTIAKRKDASLVFQLVFRWFSMLLLFAAFGFSLVGIFILDWLFPVTYHSAAYIIPIIAESIAFSGVYSVFLVGANVKRKAWLTAVFTTIAAVVNVALNLFLIPLYGAMGAAASTLIAYVVLALVTYVVNQRLYPIPFEIGQFTVALFVGVGLYVGSSIIAHTQGTYVAGCIYAVALAFYGGCLALLGKFLPRTRANKKTKYV